MNKLPKEKRDKLVLVAIMTLGTIVALYYLLIGSQQKTIDDLRQRIGAQREKVRQAEQRVKHAATVQSELDEVTRQLQEKESTMASGDRYFWFVNKISSFRLVHKVDIPQISPEAVVDVGLFPKFPYKASLFKIGGSAFYEELGKFLADFENSMGYARIQNLEVSPQGSGTGSAEERAKLSFNMEVLVLIKPAGP